MVTETAFETAPLSSPVGSISSIFVRDWDELKGKGIEPRYEAHSDAQATPNDELREEFLVGARMLGLIGRNKELKPQQLRTADVLNIGERFTGVLEPRRSSKTTTLLAWALGRCASRDDYLIAYTVCTTGKKARDRYFKDIVPVLERVFPDEDERPFRIYKSAGQERIVFKNGSVFQIAKPAGDDFRSEAYDVIILDEAGEATPEMGEDLLSAALPTQDTRPGAMLIVAGTAAKYRTGNLLWDELEKGRQGQARHGIIDYSAGDTYTHEDIETWGDAKPLVLMAHPGVGTLTTIESIEDNFKALGREQFAREYLGIFGDDGSTTGIIRPDHWEAATLAEALPEPPKHFVLGVAVRVNQASACVVAAWREDGVARVLVLEHRPGVNWLTEHVTELGQRYKVPIAYDDMQGPTLAEVEPLKRVRPLLKLKPQNTKNVSTAAALFVKEVDSGNLNHYGQDELTHAALTARKRTFRAGNAWGFGRPDADADITAIEAAALALRLYDETPEKRATLGIITGSAA